MKITGKLKFPKFKFIAMPIWLRLIRWCTYLILFIPLAYGTNFLFPFSSVKSLFFIGLAELIFFFWLILIIYHPQFRPAISLKNFSLKKFLISGNVLVAAVFLFVIVQILATVFGVDPFRSFWSNYERMTGLLIWLHLLAFFLVTSQVFRKRDDWRRIFGISVFVALIITTVSLIDVLGRDLVGSEVGGATTGNTSFLGVYLLFNSFFALWLFATGRGLLKTYGAIAFWLIALGLFLSEARAAMLAMAGGLFLLVLFWLIFKNRRRYLKFVGATILGISILTALAAAVLAFRPDNFVHRALVARGFNARLVVWSSNWPSIFERPWLGWGPENFELVFAKNFDPCLFLRDCGPEIAFDKAHNIVLETAIQFGLLGLVSYLLMFAAAFYLLWRGYIRGQLGFWTAGIFSVTLIAYFVENLTVFDLISSSLMFVLLLAFVSAAAFPKEFDYQKGRARGPWPASILLILLILTLLNFFARPMQSAFYAVRGFVSGEPSTRIAYYRRTLERSPLGRHHLRVNFTEKFLDRFSPLVQQGVRPEYWLPEFDFLAGQMEDTISQSPLDYRSHIALGDLYNAYGILDKSKFAKAEPILRRAIELGPTNPLAYAALSNTKQFLGEWPEAIELLEKAVELEPRIPDSHRNLIVALKLAGEEEKARERAAEAIEIVPELEPLLNEILEKKVTSPLLDKVRESGEAVQ